MRNSCMQMWKQAQPLLKLPTTSNYMNMEVLNPWRRRPTREKVIFVMGATGTGKSKLSMDIATQIPSSEIINSDKIQVYKGLEIVTNKVTKQEQLNFPHHLLGILNPHLEFTTKDFCLMATKAIESIHQKGKLPIIVGGSNTYIESLVSDPEYGFGPKYDCCFLWVDVSIPILHGFVSDRVDKMVESGLVEEVRSIFEPENRDYSKGIRKAIGVPEMDGYFRAEPVLDEPGRTGEMQKAIGLIKENTCKLASVQREKIYRLKQNKGWEIQRIDATQVLRKEAHWDQVVAKPSLRIVDKFLSQRVNVGSSFCAEDVVERSMNLVTSTSRKHQAVVATSL